MEMFLDQQPITIEELKLALKKVEQSYNTETDEYDIIVLYDVDDENRIYYVTEHHSVY